MPAAPRTSTMGLAFSRPSGFLYVGCASDWGENVPGPIVYSTNPFLSYEVGCRFRGDTHVVWCSEVFDPRTTSSSAPGSMIAPSSSPRSLAQKLAADVRGEDTHSDLISRYRRKFKSLATSWYADGSFTDEQAKELRELATRRSFRIWRPLVYIIPRAPLESTGRLQSVPPRQRAGHGPEFRIFDLLTTEFDVIEWMADD